MRSLLASTAAILVISLASSAHAADNIFGLSFAIAKKPDVAERVVDDPWVDAQIAEANRLFTPYDARFRWTIEKPLADMHASMHSRADRDALTPLTETQVIDVFIVRELEDVDEPGRYRRGVCWTGRGGKRFLIVSQIAGASVLAHELGHFFGNPHSPVTDNVMSYSRSGATVFFDDAQGATITAFAGRFIASGRLSDVGPPVRFF